MARTAVAGSFPSPRTRRAQLYGRLAPAGRENGELPECTEAVQLACRRVASEMRAQAARMGADGVVGVRMQRHLYLVRPSVSTWREDKEGDATSRRFAQGKHFSVVVNATGTAIVSDSPAPAGSRALSFLPVRRLDR